MPPTSADDRSRTGRVDDRSRTGRATGGEEADTGSSPGGPTSSAGAGPVAEEGPSEDEVVARLEDQLRRALADLDNLRKRHARDLDRERLAYRAGSAQAWLPVVDNLELALQHAEDRTDPVIDGVRAVHQQAVDALAQLGFPRFDAEGETFDPTLHEAVSSVPDAARAGTVVAVARPGYGTREALLRPAQVVVAMAPPASS